MKIMHIDKLTIKNIEHLPQVLPKTGYIWIDMTRDEQDDLHQIVKSLYQVDLHERHLEDQMTENHPSAFDSMYDYDFIVFRSVTTVHVPHLQTDSCAFFLFDHLLITVRTLEDEAIHHVANHLKITHRRIPQTPEALLEMILDTKVDQLMSTRTLMSNRLDRWQKELLAQHKPFKGWDALMSFKEDIRLIRMLCEEQEDVLRNWRYNVRTDIALERMVAEHLIVNLSDISEHIRRVQRHAQKLDSDLESLLQLHFSIVSNNTNQVMRMLAIISCIFLPTTLVTGIFGMNFTHIPGLDDPHGYYYTLGGMLLIAFGLIGFFKSKNWF